MASRNGGACRICRLVNDFVILGRFMHKYYTPNVCWTRSGVTGREKKRQGLISRKGPALHFHSCLQRLISLYDLMYTGNPMGLLNGLVYTS